MPLYEIKSELDLKIAIARKLPLRVSCCKGLNCCDKCEMIWDSDETAFVENSGDREYYSNKNYILRNIKLNYEEYDEPEEDRYFSEQPLIGKILKRKSL